MFRYRQLVVALQLLCFLAIASSLSLESVPVVTHQRSRRADLTTLCSAELYTAPFADICAVPKDFSHAALVKKQVAAQKKANLAAAESVCVFYNGYLEKKWCDAKGALDTKKITTDFTAMTTDADWKALIPNVLNRCIKEATESGALATGPKLKSGYKTTCKVQPYVFQTCLMSKLINNCPKKHQKADFDETRTLLAGCDHQAVVKTTAEIAKSAIGNIAKLGTGQLTKTLKKAKANAKKIEDSLSKDMKDKIGKAVPKDSKASKMDEASLEKDISAGANDPEALAKKLNINTDSLSFLGK